MKKLGEEATEIVIAAKNPNPNEIKYEIADFLYHMMVLMVERGSPGKKSPKNWIRDSIIWFVPAYVLSTTG